MKRISMWMVLLPALAVGCVAQESRQDVSISATGVLGTSVSGTPSVTSGNTLGGLASYRFMLTPRSGLELNYQYSQSIFNYRGLYACSNDCTSLRVKSRFQELSGAYVYTRNYGNWNPFVEVGVSGIVFTPIKGSGTSTYDVAQNTNLGLIYGAGLAYQISPSFDIRAEYRGVLIKEPSFSFTGLRTGVYQNLNNPVVGIAYHF